MKPRSLFLKLGFVLLGGCSFHASCNGGGMDMTKAVPFVSDFVEKYTGVKPSKVDCPKEVATKKDATFECTFEDGGVPGVMVIKQTSDEGDVAVDKLSGIIASSKIESSITDAIKQPPGGGIKADCGPRVHPSHPGDKLTCEVKGPNGVVAHAAVEIKDELNAIHFVVTDDAAPPAPAPADPAPVEPTAPTTDP